MLWFIVVGKTAAGEESGARWLCISNFCVWPTAASGVEGELIEQLPWDAVAELW